LIIGQWSATNLLNLKKAQQGEKDLTVSTSFTERVNG
jgi:hypothetical protein